MGARWARPPCMAACSAQPPNPLVSLLPTCLQLVPGLRVTGFKKSANEAIWVDGEIVNKKAAKHPRDKCHCRWGWLGIFAVVAAAECCICCSGCGALCALLERPSCCSLMPYTTANPALRAEHTVVAWLQLHGAVAGYKG